MAIAKVKGYSNETTIDDEIIAKLAANAKATVASLVEKESAKACLRL